MLQILAFCLPRCCNFQQKIRLSSQARSPWTRSQYVKKQKISLCSPQNTIIEGTLGEGTKLISIAKLHQEVLRAVKPKNLSPVAGVTDSLRSPKNVPAKPARFARTLTPSMKQSGYGPAIENLDIYFLTLLDNFTKDELKTVKLTAK